MRITSQARRTPRQRRRGAVLVELVLVLPIFVILLTAMIEFCLLLTARQELLTASREGARIASHGAPNEEVRERVRHILGDGRLGTAEVNIRHFAEDSLLPNAPRDRVQVVVQIPTTRVVPDFLGLVGISFAEDELIAGTVMSMETLSPLPGLLKDGDRDSEDDAVGHKDNKEKDK